MPEIEDTSALPREASTDRVEKICRMVSTTPRSRRELIGELDENNDAVYDTVRLGEHLGLMEESDQGITVTDLGQELIENRGRSKPDVFAEGLSNHEIYCKILRSLDKRGVLFAGPLERETVLRLLRDDYGIELSEKTLKERIGTLFQTLQAAGLGEYVFASQNTICHFGFVEGFRDRIPPGVLAESYENGEFTLESTNDKSVQTTISGNPLSTEEIDLEYDLESNEELQFNLNIQVDDSTDPEHLEKLVLAIRNAMRSEL